MSDDLILTGNTGVELRSMPIEPSWIIEGNPRAENSVLSRSADGTATTIVWQCSGGKFKWIYDFDETIHILEGSIVLHSDRMAPTRFGPGDVVFFKQGAVAYWEVEGHVRKLAFCRNTQPAFIGLALRVANKLKRMMFGARSTGPTLVQAS